MSKENDAGRTPDGASPETGLSPYSNPFPITRRSFVITGGILLTGSACNSEGLRPETPGNPIPTTGQITISVSGAHATAPNGGTAVVTLAQSTRTWHFTLPREGSRSEEVPTGTYDVTYTPPPNHVLAEGERNPRSTTIVEGSNPPVHIVLISQGGIQVSVTGLTGTATSGGSAVAQRSDGTGSQVPIAINASGAGSVTAIPTGAYSVTYTAPSGFSTSGANPVNNVMVEPGASAPVSFTVAALPQNGSIHVTVTGLTGATAGGSISARLTNDTGSTFNVTLPTPTGGSSEGDLTPLPAGSYNVSYTPPSGYRLVTGQVNPRVVAVTAGAAAATTFSAEVLPPAAGQGEPVYNPATDKLIVRDGFDSYTGITTGASPFTQRYSDYRTLGMNDQNIPIGSVVSLVVGRDGSGQALRLAYGNPGGASDIIVGTEGQLSQIGAWNGTLPEKAGPYSPFYFTTWLRFSPGADPAARNDSGVKGLMFFHNGGQRYQHSPHTLLDYQGGRYDETRWDAGPPHPPNQPITTNTSGRSTATGLNHWRTSDGAAPRFASYADGAWHRFTVEIFGGGSSGHRGERWWLDGELVFDNMDNVGSLSWGGDYSYNNPVTHWMVFGNYVTGAAASQSPFFTVDFDDWIAWTK